MRIEGETVLVTGGLGFIGSHFIRLLLGASGEGIEDSRAAGPVGAEGRLMNLDVATYAAHPGNVEAVAGDDRYDWVKEDIADPEAVEAVFEKADPALVVNFAAESHVDRSVMDARPFVDTNVRGVQVLLDACLRHGAERFVQVSTDEVYGDVAGREGPTPESAPLRPSSPYSATKAGADHLCRAYRRTHGLPVTLVRPSNNYGPNQHPEKLIPLAIRRFTAGGEVPLYGDGRQRRDWLFVEDCARGILDAIREGKPGRTYNLATGRSRENREVVSALGGLVAEETGRPREDLEARVEHVEDRPGHDRRYAPDPTRAREEVGWEPRVDFGEGLARTVRWYLEHREWVEAALDEEYGRYEEAVYGEGWAGRAGTGGGVG